MISYSEMAILKFFSDRIICYQCRSVSGMIGALRGMIVNWSSRTQKVVTLSSTESDYITLGECGQQLKIIWEGYWDYLLPTLYMSIQLYKLRFIQYIYDKYEYVICIYVFPLIIYRYILLCISTYGMPTRIIIFIFSLTFIPQRLIIFND